MSYAIASVVYGVSGSLELQELIEEELLNVFVIRDAEAHADAWDGLGFEHLYEGVSPWWFGVKIAELDETQDVDLANFISHNMFCTSGGIFPKEDVILKYNKMLEDLPSSIVKLLPPPKLSILWSSS